MTQLNLFDQEDYVCLKHPCFGRYFNTVDLAGSELKKKEKKVGGQNEKILKYFQERPEGYYTPFDVQLNLFWNEVPITSIRRAMSDLTKLGYLERLDGKEGRPILKMMGDYGHLNYTWKLK